jgi:hypothetical protein
MTIVYDGMLAQATLVKATLTEVVAGHATAPCKVNITICNIGGGNASIDLAIAATGAPAAAKYILKGYALQAKKTLFIQGLNMTAAEIVQARSSIAGTTVRVDGEHYTA